MMSRIRLSLRRFIREEEAATVVEYSVMLGLIVVTCLVTISLVGEESSAIWNNVATELDGMRAN